MTNWGLDVSGSETPVLRDAIKGQSLSYSECYRIRSWIYDRNCVSRSLQCHGL